jgi:hypothetical protein
VRNEEVKHTVKEDSIILHTIKRRESSSVGHILQEYFLKKSIEGYNGWKNGKSRKKT